MTPEPKLIPYVRCKVCRQTMRPGRSYYEVDSRKLCPECAEVYWQSHYPEMRVEEFRRAYEYTVPTSDGVYAAT